MKKVIIYTDGACRRNPGPGGWGALIRYGKHEKILSGAETDTTNNRMEVTAAIEALAALNEPCDVELHTDSQYLQKGISDWIKKWKKSAWKTASKKAVKNADLWKRLDQEAARHHIKWFWVKGHSGHHENEFVDEIANKAIDELLKKK